MNLLFTSNKQIANKQKTSLDGMWGLIRIARVNNKDSERST